ALVRLALARQREGRQEQLGSVPSRPDREVQDVLAAELVLDAAALDAAEDRGVDQGVVVELEERLELRAESADLPGDRARRDVRARPHQLDREGVAARGDVERREDLAD